MRKVEQMEIDPNLSFGIDLDFVLRSFYLRS